MDIMKKIYHFAQNYGSAFVVGDYPFTQLLFVNNTAKKLYGLQEQSSCHDISTLFQSSIYDFDQLLLDKFSKGKSIYLENVDTRLEDGSLQMANISIGSFNEEGSEFFLELTPKNDTRLEMAHYQIDHSPRPEALLSEDLSLLYCNEVFRKTLHSYSKEDPLKTCMFSSKIATIIMEKMQTVLAEQDSYTQRIQLDTAEGETQWYLLELIKRTLDNSGKDKILAYFTNINEQVEREAKFNLLNQYFSVLNDSTVDLLFRVDVDTETLYYYNDFTTTSHSTEQVIENYKDIFSKRNVIHPDDRETYHNDVNIFYQELQPPKNPIRFSINGAPYQWYKISGKKIHDHTGALKEIFGALINVEKEQLLQSQFDETNEFFIALESISGEAFYRIDVKKKQLTQTGQVAKELGFHSTIDHYPECVFDMVHPDDFQTYLNFTNASFQGDASRIEVRFRTTSGEYQWYEKESVIIRDKNGEVSQVVGKMNNIQAKHTIEAEHTVFKQYFDAMQEFSSDVLYRIDVPTMTLYHSLQTERALEIGTVIPDYLNALISKNIVHPEDQEKYLQYVQDWFEDKIDQCDVRFSLVNHEYEWYTVKGKKLFNEEGTLTEVVGTLVNIQKQREMQAEYSLLDQYFMAMQELTSNLLFHVNLRNNTFRHNIVTNDDKGVLTETPDFVETFIRDKHIRPDTAEDYREKSRQFLAGEIAEYTAESRVRDGVYERVEITGRFIYDEKGEPLEIFGKIKNIQKEIDLEQRASHDLMTGALNKVTFETKSEEIFAYSSDQERHALIFIDLDDFKGINDTLGHSCGDALLCTVAERLKSLVRGNDLVGRIGGDEFSVLLKNVNDEESAFSRTNVFLTSLQAPFDFEGNEISIKASIGIAMYPKHGTGYSNLIKKADMAVYESKKRGKNVVSLYATVLDDC